MTTKQELTDRFNPKPNLVYGICEDCGIDLPTERDADEHMRTTSHRIQILNPSRDHRLSQETDSIVADHIYSAMNDLEDLVTRGDATESEIKESLFWHDSFQEAWKEYINE